MRYDEIYEPGFLRQFAWMKDAVGAIQLPPDSFSINVDEILKRCELHTEPSTEPHVQGGITGHTVYINPLNTLEEIRFKKAHGLGHYIYGHIGPAGPYRDDNERDADAFASQLLAPKTLIMMFLRTYVKGNGVDSLKADATPLLYSAAHAMEVPEHVMRERMKTMGIIITKNAAPASSGAAAPENETGNENEMKPDEPASDIEE